MSPSRHRGGEAPEANLGAQTSTGAEGRETVRVTDACTACGACLATCPERALLRAAKRPAVVDAACTGCWACIEICPAGAILAVGPNRVTTPAPDRTEVPA